MSELKQKDKKPNKKSNKAKTETKMSPIAIDFIESINREAMKFTQTLNEYAEKVKLLEKQIQDRDLNNTKLQRELHSQQAKLKTEQKKHEEELYERDKQIKHLNSDLEKKKTECEEKENAIVDLTERLKVSLQMDSISQNQELITLKKEIVKDLKLEYLDFVKYKDVEYSSDNYEAFRGSLIRIFKALKRYDIVFE